MDAFQIISLPHDKIDRLKWDACINRSPNRVIYTYSWYLDQMSPGWDALVMINSGDGTYEAVMPLTWRKKYGIHYLYQPFLTPQLGVFSETITPQLVEHFLKQVPGKFKYADICLNHGNLFKNFEGFKLLTRKNLVLNLDRSYTAISAGYRENSRRNIKRSTDAACGISRDFDVEKVVGLALEQMRSFDKDAARNVERFRGLYKILRDKKQAITYGVVTGGDELLASAVFFIYRDRAYYILVGNHPLGKNVGASHALINAFIKDHAGKPMILDFEGSDIPGLAAFYSSFGAVEENYPAWKMNRLPFFVRWFKK